MPPENDPPSGAAHVAPGSIIAERYRVEGVLGEGGMGIVYLAEHVHIRKRVAIKVLLPRWTSAPDVVARFEREAVAAGAIAHPNVAAATDFGRLADGSFFLVLEYLEGRTLRDDLAAGAIAPARALEIARGIALGVGAAHASGIVHRDLKPENVMLVTRGEEPECVKVLDFGIARVDGASGATGATGTALTSAGAILGTPDYMAPEQAMGTNVDARADLYALGVILFEMLTGECPFRGGAVTMLRQHLLSEVPPLPPDVAPGLPESLRGLVTRLMQKDPGARLSSAAEVVAVIDAASAELARATSAPLAPTLMAPATLSAPSLRGWALSSARRAVKTPRARTGALLAALVVLVVVTAISFRSSSGGVEPATGDGTRGEATPAAAAAPEEPATRPVGSEKPAAPAATEAPSPPSSVAPRKRRGRVYIPPPSQWFR